MDDRVNALAEPGAHVAGGALKIRYPVTKNGKWIEFSPENLLVEFNGKRIDFLQELTLSIGNDYIPYLSMTFMLDDIDIDMDTMSALHAVIEAKEKSNG